MGTDGSESRERVDTKDLGGNEDVGPSWKGRWESSVGLLGGGHAGEVGEQERSEEISTLSFTRETKNSLPGQRNTSCQRINPHGIKKWALWERIHRQLAPKKKKGLKI